MASIIPHDTPVHPPEHPEDHEGSDVSIRGLTITLTVIAVVVLITFALVFVMFKLYEHHQASLDVKLTSIEQKADMPPGRPRLQGVPGFHDNLPAADADEMFADFQQRLASEGSLPNGKYHIRIDRAMQMVVDSGKLKPSTQPTDKAAPTTRSADASR